MQAGYNKIVSREMSVIDCKYGIITAPAHPGIRATAVRAFSHNIKLYGRSMIPDCPQQGKGGKCFSFMKTGIIIPTIFQGSHPMPPKYMTFAKSHVQDRDAAFAGISNFEHCKFFGFKADESGFA